MQNEPIPPISRVTDELFQEIERSSEAGTPTITSDQLSRLNFLFDKNLSRALQVLEKGHVKCYTAERSQRKVFQVQGSRPSDQYTVFPRHYCSCQAFLYVVVGHDNPLCKHQLAARLAQALHKSHNITVSDEVLAELLLTF